MCPVAEEPDNGYITKESCRLNSLRIFWERPNLPIHNFLRSDLFFNLRIRLPLVMWAIWWSSIATQASWWLVIRYQLVISAECGPLQHQDALRHAPTPGGSSEVKFLERSRSVTRIMRLTLALWLSRHLHLFKVPLCTYYALEGTGYKGQNERLVEKLKKFRDNTSLLSFVKGHKLLVTNPYW